MLPDNNWVAECPYTQWEKCSHTCRLYNKAKIILISFVCMTFYVEPCITLHILQQIKKTTRGLSVVVPAVSTSKMFE